MQTSSHTNTGYAQHPFNGAYRSMSGLDFQVVGGQHCGYPETVTDAAAFYHNYMNSGVVAAHDYPTSDFSSYSESAAPVNTSLYHPGFVHSSRDADYYKVGGVYGGCSGNANDAPLKHSDMMGVYNGNVVYNNFMARNGYKKHEDAGCGGSDGDTDSVSEAGHAVDYNYGRYPNENVYHTQQYYPHLLQQQQLAKPQALEERGHEKSNNELSEPENQPDRLATSEPNSIPQSSGAEAQADSQQHDNTQQELSQSPASDGTKPSSQSLGNDYSGAHVDVKPDPLTIDAKSTSTESLLQDNNVEKKEEATSNEVKPTLSYIALIAKSILEAPERRLNLGSIYGWIEKNFPYYKDRGQGWRNSVRHNLSLNDCFIKAGRCEDGKGNYWAIHPANMADFLRGDFRQRRRSRRRGRKTNDLGLYSHFSNGYLGSATPSGMPAAAAVQMTFPPSATALPSIYSPYTEAERRAYRLDEAFRRQSTGNPLLKWYHHSTSYPGATVPSPVNTEVCSGVDSVSGVKGVGAVPSQWPQTYNYLDNNYQASCPLTSSYSRNYPSSAIV